MENENNQSERKNLFPGMTPGQRVFFIWGPVLLKWGISIIISLIAGVLITFGTVMRDSESALNMMNDQEAMMEFAQRIVAKYTTPIEGVAAIVTIIVMIFIIRKDNKTERTFGCASNKKASFGKYWMVVLLSGMMSLALNNLILIGNLSSYSDAYQQVSEALYSPGLAVQILCLCLIVPIAEELVFRGIVYRRIRWESRPGFAIFYSAAIFAVVHGNLVQGIYGFLMGLLLGYLYEKYGSVMAPVIAHMTANLVTVLASKYGFFQWEMNDIMVIGVVTVVCAVVSSMIWLLVNKIDEKPEIL